MSLSMKQKENISYPINQFIDDMVKLIYSSAIKFLKEKRQLYIFKLKQQYYLLTISKARSIPHRS